MTSETNSWERVDRALIKGRRQLADAVTEEDFQGIGLLCREALTTLGQIVWDATRHPPLDGVAPSETDVKRRLDAYIAAELASEHEAVRKHARSAVDLANTLQHKRTASYRDAALCLEGTASVVNIIEIVNKPRVTAVARSGAAVAEKDAAQPPSQDPSTDFPTEIVEQADAFASDRIMGIEGGRYLPVVLHRGPKLILHVLPLASFKTGVEIDHDAMNRLHRRFKPSRSELPFEATTINDGWQVWAREEDPPPGFPNRVSRWCSHILNAGMAEIAMSLETAQIDGVQAITGYRLEAEIVETLDEMAEGYAGIGIGGPALVKVTMLEVFGVRLARRSTTNRTRGFDRPTVPLPNIQLDRIGKPMGNALRPVFNRLWRAAGWRDGSQSFQRSEWAGYGDGRLPVS
jgi:hypothetical protein